MEGVRDHAGQVREFRLDKKYVLLMKGCLIFFMAAVAGGFALPFLPEQEGSPGDVFVLTLLCTLVFGFLLVLTWRTLKQLPYADVAADNEGIWYRHRGKAGGLIPWERVAAVKERKYRQCLALIDRDGNQLLRIEYQLNDFEALRQMVNDMTLQLNTMTSSSGSYSKGLFHHLFSLASIVGFAALGLYVGPENPLMGYGGMGILVALIIYDYLVTATDIRIRNGYFDIVYPMGTRRIRFSEVEDVLIEDRFYRGNRIPEVWVVSKSAKKPFKLKQLGVDSNKLYKTLRAAAKV